ncbi:MAG: PA2169 family four-helix-bundle protein [Gemmobacter sp.]
MTDTTNEKFVESLSSLHTRLIDAAKGYEEARTIGTDDAVKSLCIELGRDHSAHAHALAGILLDLGRRPDSSGSFMAVVHKVAMNVRFAFSADATSLLPGLRDGESRILESYDEALREAEAARATEAHRATLADQRAAVVAHIRRIDALKVATG